MASKKFRYLVGLLQLVVIVTEIDLVTDIVGLLQVTVQVMGLEIVTGIAIRLTVVLVVVIETVKVLVRS